MPPQTSLNGVPRRLKPRRAWAPLVVLLVALAGTGAVTAFVSRTVSERNYMRFDDSVDATLRNISERLDGYIDALQASTALFAAQRNVERVAFAGLVDALDLERRHPGIRGIGWAPLVERNERDLLVKRAKAEGLEAYRIWPDSKGPVSYPILYLEPLDTRNQAAIGYDMFSEPVRRAAMERARDTGEATASGKIRLVQEIDADVQPGFLIYVPVYAGTPATLEERRASLRGFVYSPFRSHDLLKGIFDADVLGAVAVRIYDGPTADPRNLLYESAREARPVPEPSLSADRALFVAGRTWTVGLETTHLFKEQSQEHVTPLVLLSGLALSLLLAAVTWLETRARAHSERARAALQRSQDALSRANRIKDEFLAMLGHELRNPLGALANAVRVLRLRAPDDPLMQRSLDAAERQLRVQTRLVDDLLDVSRLTTGKIRLVLQKVDVGEVLRRAVSDVRVPATERSHKLVLSPSDDPLVVDGDPVRLEQIFTNLLSNAIKYTPPGGDITVQLARDGDRAVVRVRDTGMGIAPEALRNIFDLFTQTDVAKARTQGGLGIGLTLVRQLAELHGGSVEAHSAGVDRGSEFVVRLPAIEGPAEAMEPSSGPLEVLPRRPELGAQHVLVVEDNPDARQMLADLLTLLGHEVEVAEDGQKGVDVALRAQPQLMFIDLGLPEMNGYEVARRLRQTSLGMRVYLVALTGYGQPEDRQRAIEAGFDEHLVKPLDIDRLKRVLERAWHRETPAASRMAQQSTA